MEININGDTLKQNKNELSRKLEEQLKFNQLLTDISTRFINVPAEEIDNCIEDSLRFVCELLNIDQATLFQRTGKITPTLHLTHVYNIPDGPERPEMLDGQSEFPWVFHKILEGKTIVISTEDLPPEAARDRETYLHYGVHSSIVIPLVMGAKEPLGVLSFDALKEKRQWPDFLIKQVEMVAQIFTNAISRKYSELELHERDERINLAVDAAEAGVWIYYIDSGSYYASPRARELYGFGPDDIVKHEDVYRKGHPEDRESAYRAVQNAIQSMETYRAEYRFVLPDKSIRWLLAIGKPHLNSNGVTDRLLGITLDITKRKQAEEELRREKNFTDAVLNSIPGLLYLYDDQHHLVRWNKKMEEVSGYSSEELSHMQILDWVEGEDKARIASAVEKVFMEGQASVEAHLRRQENTVLPYRGTPDDWRSSISDRNRT